MSEVFNTGAESVANSEASDVDAKGVDEKGVDEKADSVAGERRRGERRQLFRNAAPQYHDKVATHSLMWTVTLVLLPAAAWGVFAYGVSALLVLAVAVLSAAAAEAIFARSGATLADGSAVLTGLLLGMMLPPTVPWFIVVAASFFAIGVVKWTFGGLGGNWLNPALGGRIFVHFSWPAATSRWVMPRTLVTDALPWAERATDAVTTATPLELVQRAVADGEALLGGAAVHLTSRGFARSELDGTVTAWLNESVLSRFGMHIPAGYIDPFIGNVPGAIGEGSAILLLLGTVVLFGKRVITWEIPTAFFATFAVLIWAFGGLATGGDAFSGDVLFHLLSGGLILAMFYVATDPVTTPMTTGGMLLFGCGVGLLTFVLRVYGGSAEGVALAVLVLNGCTPLINRYLRPRRLGAPRFGVASRTAGQNPPNGS